jgi:hypothetical protein
VLQLQQYRAQLAYLHGPEQVVSQGGPPWPLRVRPALKDVGSTIMIRGTVPFEDNTIFNYLLTCARTHLDKGSDQNMNVESEISGSFR